MISKITNNIIYDKGCVTCKYCQGGRTGHTHRQTDRQTNRIFGEGYFYVQLTHMNGFKAKKKISEGVEKCIARGIRCYASDA